MKIQYKVSSVNYIGHIFNSEGVKANEAKVKTIAGIPTDKAGLKKRCLA